MILRLQAIVQNKSHGFKATENVHIVMYYGFRQQRICIIFIIMVFRFGSSLHEIRYVNLHCREMAIISNNRVSKWPGHHTYYMYASKVNFC